MAVVRSQVAWLGHQPGDREDIGQDDHCVVPAGQGRRRRAAMANGHACALLGEDCEPDGGPFFFVFVFYEGVFRVSRL